MFCFCTMISVILCLQLMSLSAKNEFRMEERCFEKLYTEVVAAKCTGKQNQEWKYDQVTIFLAVAVSLGLRVNADLVPGSFWGTCLFYVTISRHPFILQEFSPSPMQNHRHV